MLTERQGFSVIAEVNPPTLPSMTHLALDGAWDAVMITDNVFGTIRVSPYAFAARITHDVPGVHPTVVVSTRDRNLLAIESEVRGALGNGVDSFLVVIGDTYPQVDHLANHYEVVEHLRKLQRSTTPFEVGMPTRLRKWQYRKRIDLGAQFFVTGPAIDPAGVAREIARLDRSEGDPPVFLMLVPPFSPNWVNRAERFGCLPAGDALKRRLAEIDPGDRRAFAWEQAREVATVARDAGVAGVVLTGAKFETTVDEGALWRRSISASPPLQPHPLGLA